ncbi:MAG: amidophosphoribosyltransferase [bacterium]
MSNEIREECGIFGVYDESGFASGAAGMAYLGLYALQHRGEESAGIAVSNGHNLLCHRGMGLVNQVFTDRILQALSGHIAIGHVRYSTAGGIGVINAQPILVNYKNGQIAMAHNGNLTNSNTLRRKLEESGSIFQTDVDTEVFFHLLARRGEPTVEEALLASLEAVEGAYSLVVLTKDKLIGVRDPYGFRPLCLGKTRPSHLSGGQAYCLASETSAFDQIEAEFLRDVEPGEMVIVDSGGIRSKRIPASVERRSQCVFELLYFARPDSLVFGRKVYEVRKSIGRELAREFRARGAEADIAIPVPDSATFAAMGFAEESGIPYQVGIFRNHYVGRTFIHPDSTVRASMVRIKQIPIPGVLEGKRVVVVDDTIVRGTTTRELVKTIRKTGAKEIIMQIGAPPIKFPCFYGIDMPTKCELIASSHTIEEIRKYIMADALNYLSLDGLKRAVGGAGDDFCFSCFNGEYPVDFGGRTPKATHKEVIEV